MTVNEVSKITGVSVRTLQYYDKIGLLKPASYTEAGYRVYDDSSLEKLQQILLFRELEFSLKDIKGIMDSPNYDKNKALKQQIELLTIKKEHIENLIMLARGIKFMGVGYLEAKAFEAFDTKKIDEYAKRAKEAWVKTDAYKEFEEKNSGKTKEEVKAEGERLMEIIGGFKALMDKDPADGVVQSQVKVLQEFITESYYNCTDVILSRLGVMYASGGEFTENINNACGEGVAEFVGEAIQVYCGR